MGQPALAFLLSVGALLGLAPGLAHSHDGGFASSHCEACRWAGDATPALVVLLAFLLDLELPTAATRS